METRTKTSLSERIAIIRGDPLYAGRENLVPKLDFFSGDWEGNRLILKHNSTSHVPKGAILRVIAQVSRLTCRDELRARGTYDPLAAYKSNREDNVTKAKLRFHIEPPRFSSEEFQFASHEYHTFLDNLVAIQDANVDTHKSPNIRKYRPIEGNNDNKVKVFHQLVVRRADDVRHSQHSCSDHHAASAHGASNNVLAAASPNPFSFDGWPVTGQWRTELNSFKHSHDIHPLQAFTIDGKLIHPSRYEKELPGAVVDLSFTLVHYNFPNNQGGTSRMCLNMTELHVLVPPVILPGTPVSKNGIVVWY